MVCFTAARRTCNCGLRMTAAACRFKSGSVCRLPSAPSRFCWNARNSRPNSGHCPVDPANPFNYLHLATHVPGFPAMRLWNDFRHGFRSLRKAPGFSATAAITMALGIGATTAIFSVCDGMLWKPVPLPDIDRLAMVLETIPGQPNDWESLTLADLADIQQQSRSFRRLSWWTQGLANIVGSSGESERVEEALIGPHFFDVVGVQPAIGRGFQADEHRRGNEQ